MSLTLTRVSFGFFILVSLAMAGIEPSTTPEYGLSIYS